MSVQYCGNTHFSCASYLNGEKKSGFGEMTEYSTRRAHKNACTPEFFHRNIFREMVQLLDIFNVIYLKNDCLLVFKDFLLSFSAF